MRPTDKQMKARMIDVHYNILSWVALGRGLKTYPVSGSGELKGMYKAASTLFRWGAITPATKDTPNQITTVGGELVKYWINRHRGQQ